MNTIKSLKFIVGKVLDVVFGPTVYEDEPNKLNDAIKQTYKQGKLLILHVYDGDTPKFTSIELPESDFLIFNTKLTQSVFSFLLNYKVSSIPFCGCFYCPSDNPSDCKCIRQIPREEEIALVFQSFFAYKDFLLDRRYRENNREIINEQDQQYQEEYQNQLDFEEEEYAEEEDIQYLDNFTKEEVEARFSSLPEEPSENDPDAITVKCNINGKTKVRRFLITDSAAFLYDFVAIDTFPEIPLIRYGFPSIQLEDYDKTFADLHFSKKEMVYVEI